MSIIVAVFLFVLETGGFNSLGGLCWYVYYTMSVCACVSAVHPVLL